MKTLHWFRTLGGRLIAAAAPVAATDGPALMYSTQLNTPGLPSQAEVDRLARIATLLTADTDARLHRIAALLTTDMDA